MVLGGAALVVGLTSGIGVWLFKQLIDLVHRLTYDGLGGALSTISPWLIALVPVIGGVIVGLLMHFFVGEERHHGVAGIMEAVALAGGRLRYKRIADESRSRRHLDRRRRLGRPGRSIGADRLEFGIDVRSMAALVG